MHKKEALKKAFKILFIFLLIILGIFISISVLINITPVQNFVVRQITHKLSKQLHTEVEIKHVDFKLFNKFQLEGTYVADQKGDTLLFAKELDVNITNFFFLRNRSELYYLGMEDVTINMDRPQNDSTWNFQFLIDAFSNPDKKKNPPPNIALKKIDLKNIHLTQEDHWKGKKMDIRAKEIRIQAEDMSLKDHRIHLNNINLDHPLFVQVKDKKNMDSIDKKYAYSPPPSDTSELQWNKAHWDIRVKKINIQDGAFTIAKKRHLPLEKYFDPDYIHFYDIDGTLKNTRFKKDSLISHLHLKTRERGGIEVKKLTGRFKMSPVTIEVSNLDLMTNESHIKDFFALQFHQFHDLADFTTKVTMKGNFKNTFVTSGDIGFFAPTLKDWNKNVTIDGLIQGTLNRLSGEDLLFKSGKNSVLEGDFSMTGLPDIYNTFIDCQIKDLQTTGQDIQSFLPALKANESLNLSALHSVHYQGTYSGFIFDFVSYGNLTTNLGQLHTDINFKFGPEHTPPEYSGKISSSGFHLGKLLAQKNIGKVAFNTQIRGEGFSLKDVNTGVDGEVDLLEFKGYPYHNIKMDASLKKKLFQGQVAIADTNLALNFKGNIDFNKDTPRFKFQSDIQKSDLHALNLSKDTIAFSGKLDMDLKGNNLDDFIGEARLFDINLYKNRKRLALDTLVINSGRKSKNNKWLTLRGNGFSGNLNGNYRLSQLPNVALLFLHHYFPNKIKAPKNKDLHSHLKYTVTFDHVDSVVHTLYPYITHLNGGQLKGEINVPDRTFNLELNLNQAGFRHYTFNDIRLQTNGSGLQLNSNNVIGEIYLKDSLILPETIIETTSHQDTSLISLHTLGNTALNSANIRLKLILLKDGFYAKFLQSVLSLNKKRWIITPDNEIRIQQNDISIQHFKLSHNNQKITLTSTEDTNNKNTFLIHLQDLNIHDFSQLFLTDIKVEGIANGQIEVIHPLDTMKIKSKLTATHLRLNQDPIGKLTASVFYNRAKSNVQWDIEKTDNPDKNFRMQGLVGIGYNKKLKGDFDLNHTDLAFLTPYVKGYVSNLSGTMSGNLSLKGDRSHPELIGKVKINQAKFMVDYTKVWYTINNESIHFKPGKADLGSLVIKDSSGRTGVINGEITYQHFNDIHFDAHMNTQGLQLVNTTIQDNPLYYGHVIAAGKIDFTGPLSNMKMVINATPLSNTHIYLPLNDTKDIGDHDFIVFKKYGKALTPPKNKHKTNLSVKLFADMNPNASIDVIVDATSGDHITAKGNGALQMNVDLNGGFNLYGNYAITEGQYVFSFRGLLTRKFAIDKGSSITWNGNPFDANINITGVYHVPGGANLYNLISGDASATAGLTTEDKQLLRQRENIDVSLSLKNSLMHPDITYDIRIPDASISASSLAMTKLQEIRQNPNTLINQVAGLLAAGQFIPITSSNASTNILRSSGLSSAGQWVSSQLTGVLNNLFEDQLNDLGVNFSLNYNSYSASGDNGDIFRNDVQFNVSKNLFNNRIQLKVGPSINWGRTSATSNSTNSYFAGDFRLEYLINPSGQLRFIAFSRSNYNILLNHNLTRAGIGLSYSHQFDQFKDLFRNKKEKAKEDSARKARFKRYLQENKEQENPLPDSSSYFFTMPPDSTTIKED